MPVRPATRRDGRPPSLRPMTCTRWSGSSPGRSDRRTQRTSRRERSTRRAGPPAIRASRRRRTICARLADRNGKPMAWSEVLRRALDESASPEHAERRRMGEPEAAHLDARHVIYALRLAAGRRETKSLTPDEYEEERRAILAEEGRRQDLGRNLQAELLPTVGQIEWLMRDSGQSTGGPWDAALAIAELEPRSNLRDQRRHRGRRLDSLPLVEAIHHYVEANGTLPSREQFKEFRRLADVKVETRSGGWTDALRAAIAYGRSSGWRSRPRCRPSGNRRRERRGRSRSLRAGSRCRPGSQEGEEQVRGGQLHRRHPPLPRGGRGPAQPEGLPALRREAWPAGTELLPGPRRLESGATQGEGRGTSAEEPLTAR